MSVPAHSDPQQLGFDALLSSAADANRTREQDRACAHLPSAMEGAVPFYRDLLAKHHQAMLTGDIEAAMALRNEAHLLAEKLNNYAPGILANEDAPGCILDRLTRAPDGIVPLWGQSGSFEITCGTMRVCIEMEGIFGIGACSSAWMGFAAHAVEQERPFLSETGYRSFLGVGGALAPALTPESFAAAVIAAHVAKELKGKLRRIVPVAGC